MKTDDLIKALAADQQPAPGARETLLRALPPAVLATAVLMLVVLGLRPDAMQAIPATAMKLSITLSLALAALALLPLVATGPALGRMKGLLWIAPVLLAGFAVVDIVGNGSAGALTRMVGMKSNHCLILIPMMSVVPLAALMFALRRGMATNPTIAGAVAGLAAAGIGASLYALNCMEDSPLFVASWYTIAVLIVTGTGALIGSRLLRW